MEINLPELLALSLPTIIMGIVAYYFINLYLKSVKQQQQFQALQQRKKEGLPIKLQAYERMMLFCERINPIKLLLRIQPIDTSTEGYLQLVLQNIEQEFEHNAVQQLYISENSWNIIITAKTAVINQLNQTAKKSSDAADLRKQLLQQYESKEPPTEAAISFIKNEVRKLI